MTRITTTINLLELCTQLADFRFQLLHLLLQMKVKVLHLLLFHLPLHLLLNILFLYLFKFIGRHSIHLTDLLFEVIVHLLQLQSLHLVIRHLLPQLLNLHQLLVHLLHQLLLCALLFVQVDVCVVQLGEKGRYLLVQAGVLQLQVWCRGVGLVGGG